MFNNMSLKYRIAVIIFILEAVIMSLVLQQTLGQSYEASSNQIKKNQNAILELVSGISKSALITEEYAELQPYIENLLKNTEAAHIILSDINNVIVVSNISNEIGKPFDSKLTSQSQYSWKVQSINNATEKIGKVSIAFSDQELTAAYNQARDFGIGIALIGMLIIAAVGILVGHLLTRKLEVITNAANRVSAGDYTARTNIDSHDELGSLARTFDKMVFHFIENKDELQQALKSLQLREQDLIESELRFRQLAENIQEVFWLGSADWNQVYYVSPAYEKNWGQNTENLYNDPRVWLEAIHPDDREQVIADIPTDIASVKDFVDFHEYRIIKPDGNIIWVKARAYPIRDKSGQVTRVAGIAENITVRKTTEDSLHHAQKMDALGKLTGGIAHDFNNMLGIVLGYTELLESSLKNSNPDLLKYSHEIFRAGERGAKLTQRLLSFTRKSSGSESIISLNNQLNELQHMLEKTLTARIKLVYDLDENLWPIKIDSAEFDDAVINICINAMHAIKGKGNITIRTHNEHLAESETHSSNLLPGDYVQLSITDTGSGMDTTTKEKIFDPFFSTKGEGGTGLGLSQVYGFVERSKGEIKVYSELNHGTRLSLYFPRHHAINAETDENIISEETSLAGTETVLVVDDEKALLGLTEEVLLHNGYKVLTADNAQTALDILGQNKIDLLISDVIMPEMDGYELASIVQKKYPEVKIQLASGFNDNRHADMVDKQLSENILPKPYHSQTLLKRLRDLLNA